jgi:holo-[acyl-carrier protein] synthase
MISGIGTDIVYIPRMKSLLVKHGDKIAKRILSDDEFTSFEATANQAAFLAKRFAAKEAASKALGTGFRDGLSLRHISVKNNSLGRPELSFQQRAKLLVEELNIGKTFLSLSDEQDYAIAYVTLMERTDVL